MRCMRPDVRAVIPVSKVQLGAEEERLVLEVLRSGQLAQGPMVERLEAEFAELCGVEHAMAVNSGTTALVVALEALDLQPGDEVITSPFTFVATLNAILEAGATARFADIDAESFTIDPDALATQVGPATRVVIPVHLYGLPADMTAIEGVSDAAGATIVEDAAQAHGAMVEARPVGSFGIGCFSLYATKNVTAGEGGIVTTNDALVADRIRLLRNQGMRLRYQYVVPGHNYRLTDVQAAIALPQLDRLAKLNASRGANAEMLAAGLAGTPGLVLPTTPPGRAHVFHQYTVRVTSGASLSRSALADALAARGIATGVYYPALVHAYDCFREHPRVVTDHTPVAEQAAREVLSLPVHPALDVGDIERVIDTVRDLLG